MSKNQFDQLGLSAPILRALDEEGYIIPTPIQDRAIPAVLQRRDLMATAQTGTGKTAAFALPILHLLQQDGPAGRGLRALVLTPTRELALQIDQSVQAYGRHLPFRTVTVLGGVPDRPQIQALRRKPDLLVATPGRLLDLMAQGHVHFDQLEFLVLDEADRMLDMGFIRDVRRILQALPARRQSLLFSATLPRQITELAATMLHDAIQVSVAPAAAVADNINQKVLFVEQRNKKDLLADILKAEDISRALVFTRTKHRANRVAQQLSRKGIAADAIHSNKSQGARQRALAAFDGGNTRVLVATDIVARGIDVEAISHVINFELPNEPESYVHRIGRTARAGAAGTALSFCNADEVEFLESIEQLTRVRLSLVADHAYHSAAIAALRSGGTTQLATTPASRRGSGSRASAPSRGNAGSNGGERSQRGNGRGDRGSGGKSNGANGSQPVTRRAGNSSNGKADAGVAEELGARSAQRPASRTPVPAASQRGSAPTASERKAESPPTRAPSSTVPGGSPRPSEGQDTGRRDPGSTGAPRRYGRRPRPSTRKGR